MSTNTIESIQAVLSALDPVTPLCDLPDGEFEQGGAITLACRLAGYAESGRDAVNDLSAWNLTVAEFAAKIGDA
jgi:hypothetical protein